MKQQLSKKKKRSSWQSSHLLYRAPCTLKANAVSRCIMKCFSQGLVDLSNLLYAMRKKWKGGKFLSLCITQHRPKEYYKWESRLPTWQTRRKWIFIVVFLKDSLEGTCKTRGRGGTYLNITTHPPFLNYIRGPTLPLCVARYSRCHHWSSSPATKTMMTCTKILNI